MTSFIAEIIEARTKKDGIDRRVRIVLETEDDKAMELRKYIAEKTVISEVKEEEL